MFSSNNPFEELLKEDSKNKRAIYISPEDLRGKLSGGHIEALTDAYLLSRIYKEVIILFPDHEDKLKNILYQEVNIFNNLKFLPLKCNKSLINYILLCKNRISLSSLSQFLKNNDNDDNHFIIGCHRNLIPHLYLVRRYGINRCFFKSYGSIFLHNFDNIIAILRSRSITGSNHMKRFISMIFYLPLESLSYVFSNKIFFTRSKCNVIRNLLGGLYNKIYHKKTIYSCSGPYWYWIDKKLNYKVNYKNSSPNKIIIGSLGDNTFPTATLGLSILIRSLIKIKTVRGSKIIINIAGKINSQVQDYLLKDLKNEELKINFLGYIENKDDFICNLDGMLLPVSGGSALPIKAIEALLTFHGPILATPYIDHSCSGFFKSNKNIFYSSKQFIKTISNSKDV